ncbi:unnamed protein product [Cuscuta campestris]|uniref:Uncharacterized protein n=1 Tax=Cuscuta campestris TaxID=132261 RepID=A0A484KXN7_9ASTE|nr:unnamed protein product [Cuscuta campestris]
MAAEGAPVVEVDSRKTVLTAEGVDYRVVDLFCAKFVGDLIMATNYIWSILIVLIGNLCSKREYCWAASWLSLCSASGLDWSGDEHDPKKRVFGVGKMSRTMRHEKWTSTRRRMKMKLQNFVALRCNKNSVAAVSNVIFIANSRSKYLQRQFLLQFSDAMLMQRNVRCKQESATMVFATADVQQNVHCNWPSARNTMNIATDFAVAIQAISCSKLICIEKYVIG